MVLLSTNFQTKETNGLSINDRSRHDQITWITANAVEEDVRRPYRKIRRTKRSTQRDHKIREKDANKEFMSFANSFKHHWDKRKTNIEDLLGHYVRTC